MRERKDPSLAHFGKRVATELARLIQWAHAPPTRGDVATWEARMGHRIDRHRDRKDEAGTFARHLDAETGHLWVFLFEEGVDPTNNRPEKALRFAVLWRRMMQGSFKEKGRPLGRTDSVAARNVSAARLGNLPDSRRGRHVLVQSQSSRRLMDSGPL